MKKKHCLILGGTGFLGRNLCHYLKDKYQISIYAKSSLKINLIKQNYSGVDVVEGDFISLSENDISLLLKDVDVIFHLISTTKPSNLNLTYEFKSNVISTLKILDACRGKDIRIVFFSSGGTVYGVDEESPIKEDAQTNPISAYGIQKLTIEKCIEYYGRMYGLDYLIFRISNPYGPCDIKGMTQGVIPIFISHAMLGRAISIWGNGKIIRDYIFVSDLMEVCEKAIDYNGKYRLFNVGTGQGYSLLDVLRVIEENVSLHLNINFLPERKQDVPSNILDCSRLKNIFKWEPKVTLEQGIKYMISIWNEKDFCFEYKY